MGGAPLLVVLLTVGVLSRPRVSVTDCQKTNCEFVVRDECQDSQTVFCDMKDFPLKQINITATSFPRNVNEIIISNAEAITFQEGAIDSLAFLQELKLTNIKNVTFLPRSLARSRQSKTISVRIRTANSLQLHSSSIPDWRGSSKIEIEDVDHCRVAQSAVSSAEFRKMSLTQIKSLAIDSNAFSGGSVIQHVRMMKITSLLISQEAFAPNATIHDAWFHEVNNFTIKSRGFATTSVVNKARLDKIPYLTIDSDGIQADIAELKVFNAGMERCEKNTFGTGIGSLSLMSSRIKWMKPRCIEACKGWHSLLVENSHFDRTDTLAICGEFEEVNITNSQFGKIASKGLEMNVTKSLFEDGGIHELLNEAFQVSAAEKIIFNNCTVDFLKKDAFKSLNFKQGAKDVIRLESVTIKHLESGSQLFDQKQTVGVWKLKLDTPCTCDKTLTKLDVPSSSHWSYSNSTTQYRLNQTPCRINNEWPILGHYLMENCPPPTTTPPATSTSTNTPTTGRPPLRGGRPPLREGSPTPDDPQADDRQPSAPPKERQPDPSDSDQVRTGGPSQGTLIGIIVPIAVVIVIIVAVVFVCRQKQVFKTHRSSDGGFQDANRRERQTSDSSQRGLLDAEHDAPTHAGREVPHISHPMAQRSGIPAQAESAESSTTHETEPRRDDQRPVRQAEHPTSSSARSHSDVGTLPSRDDEDPDARAECSGSSRRTEPLFGREEESGKDDQDYQLVPIVPHRAGSRVPIPPTGGGNDTFMYHTMPVRPSSHERHAKKRRPRGSTDGISVSLTPSGSSGYVSLGTDGTLAILQPTTPNSETPETAPRKGSKEQSLDGRHMVPGFPVDRLKDPRIQQLERDPNWPRYYIYGEHRAGDGAVVPT